MSDFDDFLNAPRMTVEEIRALGHEWEPMGDGTYGTWLRCRLCGALIPSGEQENTALFRKTTSGSVLLTNHGANAKVTA